MVEPVTPNINLVVPNTGDLVSAWGTAAVNPNMLALDGMLGGQLSLALSAASTVTLTAPPSISTASGPTQSQNAVIFLSGTLTGNNTILVAMPGKYTFHNKCLGNNSYYIQIAPSAGTGSTIGLPPGEKSEVFYDGTNCDYVGLGRVGAALDLHNWSTYPPWMSACSTLPYLIKNGSVYSTSVYPILGELLGSTFGGNGASTFGVPDEMSRVRLPIDIAGTNRITNAVCGISGTTMGASGGNQNMQSHTHAITDNGHAHGGLNGNNFLMIGSPGAEFFNYNPLTGGANYQSASNGGDTAAAATGITINNTGSGGSQNVQPTIVDFLPLIRAA